MLGKNFTDNILKYFSYFSEKISFGILCKLSPGDNLHEMSKLIFREKLKKNHHFLCAEFALEGGKD